MKAKAAAIDLRLFWQLTGFTILTAILILLPGVSYAVTPVNSPVGNYICMIAYNFSGDAGRGIATIGISVLGTLAILGRVTWTQALIIGVGVATLFGAPVIIVQLGANSACV